MKQLIELMLQIPAAMARIGAEQMQAALNHRGDGIQNVSSELHSEYQRASADARWSNPGGPQSEPTSDSSERSEQPTGQAPFTAVQTPIPQTVTRVAPADLGRLNVSTMVVLGEDLAAGMSDFALMSDAQNMAFPGQLARHLGAAFKQPLFEAPGLGAAAGLDSESVRLPDLNQTTVFDQYPPATFGNLSIPGFTVRDCLRLRPCLPLVHQDNAKQTLANMVLTPGALISGQKKKLSTQLESAIGQCPTFVVLALGFQEVLRPALCRRPAQLPPIAELLRDYELILKALSHSKCDVLLLNIPDPVDTACLSSLESAARVLKISTESLRRFYDLHDGDFLTVAGLLEIGHQINRRRITSLERDHVLPADAAATISGFVHRVNQSLSKVATQCERTTICDIAAYFQSFAQHGQTIGARHLTGDYLGGFYTLNGYSPGYVAHGLIANHIIHQVNESFSASLPAIPLEDLVQADPVASYRTASGRNWSDAELDAMRDSALPKSTRCGGPRAKPLSGEALDRRYNAIYRDPPENPLRLPPNGTQILPINSHSSYHGDAMRMINCARPEDVAGGACGNNAFDGLAMFGAQLNGSLRFEFAPPVNNVSHFIVTLDGPLTSEDGVLATPRFLRFPLLEPRVIQPPGTMCSGDVNLVTGDVSNLDFMFFFQNSGLKILQELNPQSFPSPALIRFKQSIAPEEQGRIYGTAWARFHQRDDGQLDFLFHGTAFVPMGPGFRFALPLGSPDNDFATVPANGTQLHPHLHLSTVVSEGGASSGGEPWIPTNAIHEFTADTTGTDFGDDFTLNHPDLGLARGRSLLAGRMMIQFGERFGDCVPFAARMLPPGGLIANPNLSPLQDVFPGRLTRGMTGHDAVLRFPLTTYRQNDLYLIDDPFDVALGAVNIHTGEVIGDFLHRAFLGQALFYALVRVEPRTPQGSFQYRGPAMFARGPNGQLRYRFNGTVFLPYVEGFLFPHPDLANGLRIGADSRLDPYFQVDAVHETKQKSARKNGSSQMLHATTGDRFSYKYSVSNKSSEPSSFEYTNHSQKGTFRMCSLAWVRIVSSKRGKQDIITFSGFGSWSPDTKDRTHIATVQISANPDQPYVSIMIDGGDVSNVNTKPKHETPPLTALEHKPRG